MWRGIAKPGPRSEPGFSHFQIRFKNIFSVVPFSLGSGILKINGVGGFAGESTLESDPLSADNLSRHKWLGISSANTYNLESWFQLKLLHVYFNNTNKDRSV